MDTVISTRPVTARLPAGPQRLHRISLDQYHHLIAIGLFRPSDRLVLLDGLLVDKMTKGPRHCTASEAAWRAIDALLPADWHARKEDPIALPGGPSGFGSEPEPDIVVVSGPSGTYKDHHPGPGEIALVVEVADSTLDDDRAAGAVRLGEDPRRLDRQPDQRHRRSLHGTIRPYRRARLRELRGQGATR